MAGFQAEIKKNRESLALNWLEKLTEAAQNTHGKTIKTCRKDQIKDEFQNPNPNDFKVVYLIWNKETFEYISQEIS